MSGTNPVFRLPHPLPSHPRLLASSTDWLRLRKQIPTDPASARIYSTLKKKAEGFLKSPLLERKMTGCRLLHISRLALERISILALVARVEEDPRFTRRALEEMLNVSRFSDWNPAHFLDVAEMSLGLAIGYDWLQDLLSPADCDLIAEALIEKGINPSFAEPEQGFIRGNNNWNQVCHAGLSAAAIAIAGREPQLAEKVLQRALDNLHLAAGAYAPDGAYPEGPMYWNYGTSFHVVLAAAFKSLSGSAQGVDSYPGFKESADYVTQMTRPDGLFYNYSDCRETRHLLIPLFWFASHFGRPDWIRADLKQVDHYMDLYEQDLLDDSNYRLLALGMLWYDPSGNPDSGKSPECHWHGKGTVPLTVHRSSFDHQYPLYAAIKGGSPSACHGHMDVGSFFLQSDGIAWAKDLGMQDYHSLESINVNLWDGKENGTRWSVFRLGPESHNILRFNGTPQRVKGHASFVRVKTDGTNPFSIVDLGQIYDDQIQAVQRGLMFVENKAVLIQDEWTAGGKACDVTWQMLTGAEVTFRPGILQLKQDGKSLTLQLPDAPRIKIEVVDVAVLQQPYDAPNPGIKRISLKLKTEAGQSGRLRVWAVPESSGNIPAPKLQNLSDWV
jgi:hypothetical protein